MADAFKNNYFVFSLLVVVIVIFISAIMAVMTYSTVIQETQLELQLSAQRVEHSLSSFFDEIQSLMLYVGKRIANSETKDSHVIWEQMKDVLGRRKWPQKQWAWPAFAWLDSEDQFRVESNYGIITTHFDFSYSIRKYVKASRENPWMLNFVDSPGADIPAYNMALFGGLGVIDRQGNYMGTLNVGFDLSELAQRIHMALEIPAIEFVMYNKKRALILSSIPDNVLSAMEHYFFPIVGKTQLTGQDEELLNGWKDSFLTMAYARKISGYPFTVITYMQPSMFMKKYYDALILHLLEIAGMGLFCLLLLHFFWKRIRKKNLELKETKNKLERTLSLAKASDDAKEEFLRCTNNELMIPLNGMTNNVSTLLKNLKSETDVELVTDKQIALLDGILDYALDFKNLTNNIVDLKEVDLQSIIEECTIIVSKAAFEKSIAFEIKIDPDLPKLKADTVKIKQIFVGLFTRAIRYSSQKQKIEISASKEAKEGRAFVRVTIRDGGFGLSDEMIDNLEQNLNGVHEKDYMEMKFTEAERLMELHHGMFASMPHPGKGTVVTLFFPLFNPNTFTIKNPDHAANVLQISSYS